MDSASVYRTVPNHWQSNSGGWVRHSGPAIFHNLRRTTTLWTRRAYILRQAAQAQQMQQFASACTAHAAAWRQQAGGVTGHTTLGAETFRKFATTIGPPKYFVFLKNVCGPPVTVRYDPNPSGWRTKMRVATSNYRVQNKITGFHPPPHRLSDRERKEVFLEASLPQPCCAWNLP